MSTQTLTQYQQRLFDYIQQSAATLPAGTPDSEVEKYVAHLLQSVVDHDVAQVLDEATKDLEHQKDHLTVALAESGDVHTENQLDQIRQSL